MSRGPFTEADIHRAVALHERLVEWLEVEAADGITPNVVLTTLTYEIGRIAGLGTLGQPESEIDGLVEQLAAGLRDQIRAVRRGLTH